MLCLPWGNKSCGQQRAVDILCFHPTEGFLTLLNETFSHVSIRNYLYKPLVNLIAEHMGSWYRVEQASSACFQLGAYLEQNVLFCFLVFSLVILLLEQKLVELSGDIKLEGGASILKNKSRNPCGILGLGVWWV